MHGRKACAAPERKKANIILEEFRFGSGGVCREKEGRKEGRRNSKGSSPVFFCRFRFARRQTRPKASYKVSKNCTPMFEKS